MKTELTPIAKIKTNPDNPRIIKDDKFDKLVKSIQEFPEMLAIRPIVVNSDMMVLGGNMRLRACQKAGFKEVPVLKADDLTPEQQKRFIITDNASFGAWDYDVLANEWEVADLEAWGVDVPDWCETMEAKEDNYEVPDEIKTDIVIGDLFEIGQHRLLCGDSTDSDQLTKLMNGEKYNLVVTDPPYNVNYSSKQELLNLLDGGKRNTNEILNDNVINREDYNGWIKKIMGVLELFHSDYNSVYVFGNAESLIGIYDVNKLHVSNMLVWVKNRLVLGRQDYNGKHENIIYGWFNHHKWYGSNSSVTVFEDELDIEKLKKEELKKILTEILSDKIKTTVIKCDTPIKSGLHPTMKPILLIAELITNSSQLNEIVLDLFLGSGSTMVAAHQLNRKCYGMELDEKYCQVIIDRMRKLDPTLTIKRNGKEITE
jgi:DNA modification methylase